MQSKKCVKIREWIRNRITNIEKRDTQLLYGHLSGKKQHQNPDIKQKCNVHMPFNETDL